MRNDEHVCTVLFVKYHKVNVFLITCAMTLFLKNACKYPRLFIRLLCVYFGIKRVLYSTVLQ